MCTGPATKQNARNVFFMSRAANKGHATNSRKNIKQTSTFYQFNKKLIRV